MLDLIFDFYYDESIESIISRNFKHLFFHYHLIWLPNVKQKNVGHQSSKNKQTILYKTHTGYISSTQALRQTAKCKDIFTQNWIT